MTTPEQVEFIRHQLAAGVSRSDITRSLTGTGWAAHDIDEAFAQAMPKPMVPQMSTFTAAAPVSSPISAATPIGQVASHPASVTTASPRHPRTLWIIAGAALFAILCGVATYAYLEKLWPFAHLPYTQDNLVSGLLASSAKIMTSSYAASATLAVGPRDADAVPFTPKVANETQLAAQY